MRSTNPSILLRAEALTPRLIEIRRTIHRHPELGFAEHRTAALVADTLNSLGVGVKTGVGQTGVVGEMGDGDALVAVRADMDALPIQELNQVEYASEVPGVMHACGHDVHTTCLLGAAMLLKEMPLAGRVRFLFQPSEEGMDAEGKSGARRMVEAGALDDVQAVFGMHVDSKYESGTLACSPGYMLASMDAFKILILGHTAHGAQAYLGVDAISLAAQVINAMHAIVSRRIPAVEDAVLSIGVIQGGTKENILADQVELRGTLRTFDPEIRKKLIEEMHKACSIAKALGGDYQLAIQEGYPAVQNDARLTAFARQVAGDLVGPVRVMDVDPEMGSEDFSFFTQRAPGCYVTLGVRPKGEAMRPLHNANFDVDESVIPLGTAILAQLAIRYLEESPLKAG